MKANLLLLILIIGFNSSLVAQTSQVITDSVTVNGRVTDYDNHSAGQCFRQLGTSGLQ